MTINLRAHHISSIKNMLSYIERPKKTLDDYAYLCTLWGYSREWFYNTFSKIKEMLDSNARVRLVANEPDVICEGCNSTGCKDKQGPEGDLMVAERFNLMIGEVHNLRELLSTIN